MMLAATQAQDDRRIVSSPTLTRMQFLATTAVVLLPFLGTLAAIVWCFWRPPTSIDLLLFGFMWFWTSGVGVVAYHRYFTHGSFETSSIGRLVLGVAGSMLFQGPVVYWVTVHRRHHEHSDQDGDPHSPVVREKRLVARLRGLWHGHIGWMASHEIPNPLHYTPDLLKGPLVMWISRCYLPIASCGLFIPAAVGGLASGMWVGAVSGLLWGGLVRLFVCNNLTWAVNSIGHSIGRQPYNTGDYSRNFAILAILNFGESWHNNHHAFPTSAAFGQRWWEVDPGYYIIRSMSLFRLAWRVRVHGPRDAILGSEQ